MALKGFMWAGVVTVVLVLLLFTLAHLLVHHPYIAELVNDIVWVGLCAGALRIENGGGGGGGGGSG